MKCGRGIRRGQAGVTLVELMVAMAIGLIVVAGLAMMFANSSQAGRELDNTSRQIENGRYAVDLLSQEMAAAGFYGDVPYAGGVYTQPDPCATAIDQLGWDDASKKRPDPIEGKTASEMAGLGCSGNPSASSPAVVLRRLDTNTTPQASVVDSAAIAYVQTSQCNNDLASTAFVASTQKSAFILRNLTCTGPGEVRRYLSRIYYVASCNECSGAGVDTLPTLKRAEVSGNKVTVTPLAVGIEHIALEYGFDTNNDGSPDVYRTGLSGVAGAADNAWSNVVTARVYVLARTVDEVPAHTDVKRYVMGLQGTLGPYNDKYKRKVFVATAKLQNVAGPREN
ncbi:PilW family protein [Curvibacter fontanus]|jgi:type IV pilus assembly protein PilW